MHRATPHAWIFVLIALACSNPSPQPSAAPVLGPNVGVAGATSAAAPFATPSGTPAATDLQSTAPSTASNGPSLPADEVAASRRPNLQWKRAAAFENDLANALSLPKDGLCSELGKVSCVHGVHLAPLGSHDPFETGLLEPSGEPLATTPTVVDRIVLSACSARLMLDQDVPRSEAKLFGAIDLAQPAPPPSAAETQQLVGLLYQRLLARDADPQEIAAVSALAVDEQGQAVAARDFALTACFVIGTTTEALFF